MSYPALSRLITSQLVYFMKQQIFRVFRLQLTVHLEIPPSTTTIQYRYATLHFTIVQRKRQLPLMSCNSLLHSLSFLLVYSNYSIAAFSRFHLIPQGAVGKRMEAPSVQLDHVCVCAYVFIVAFCY